MLKPAPEVEDPSRTGSRRGQRSLKPHSVTHGTHHMATNVKTATEQTIPDLGTVPEVAAACKKRDELQADAGRVKKEIASLEANALTRPNGREISDTVEIEARRLAGDPSMSQAAERLARLQELRKQDKVLTRAVAISQETLQEAERRAAASLSPEAIAATYSPKVRAAAMAYVKFVGSAIEVSHEYQRLHNAGFYSGLSNPFQATMPTNNAYGSGLPNAIKRLIDAGALTAEEAGDFAKAHNMGAW